MFGCLRFAPEVLATTCMNLLLACKKRLSEPRAQTRACKRKTLVLDLDETLVHSTLDGLDLPDFSFPVFFNG